MIKLIYGSKGTGKTKQLIQAANANARGRYFGELFGNEKPAVCGQALNDRPCAGYLFSAPRTNEFHVFLRI